MKKTKRTVKVVEATRSRVDVEFIRGSVLPEEAALHVSALLAGVSDRTARKQLRKFNKAGSPA